MSLFRRKLFSSKTRRAAPIDPDEVLLDAFNLPDFNTHQLEGRVERSIRSSVPLAVGGAILVVFGIFLWQSWDLQVTRGEAMAVLSEQNQLDHEIVFARRGVIYDRFGRELAWNTAPHTASTTDMLGDTFSLRSYSDQRGVAHILGFVDYPAHDQQGNWWRTEYEGRAGVESSLDTRIAGTNGVRIIEVDALGRVQSANTLRAPVDGENVTLTIDAVVQEALFTAIRDGAQRSGFTGGAGVIMDARTGEVVALTSYPEYDVQVMTDGVDTDAIAAYVQDERDPFLNRAVLGEYTPGSIVKPYIAAAALAEGVITPEKQILSTGEIRIPNPYYPDQYSTFRDWKAHGWVDVRRAVAVSSNVYFYAVGGGYEDQQGLGIDLLASYAHAFGLGEPTGIDLASEASGVVPTPEWKSQVFGEDDPWRLGNTYHTSIGQFGFLVTPLQAVRYMGALANGGTLLTPHVQKDTIPTTQSIGIDDATLRIVRDGMRRAVQGETAAAVNVAGIDIAAKTGTAQLGRNNELMNSWVVGFWPAERPQFAFAVVLERAPAETLVGAAPAMRSFFEWLVREQPSYAAGAYPVREDAVAAQWVDLSTPFAF